MKANETSGVPVCHSEIWMAAFRAQATAELYARASHYAINRAESVHHVTGRFDDQYAMELVQAAIADTFLGNVTWDPERCTLEHHVLKTIQGRSRHDRERASEVHNEPLDTDEPLHDHLQAEAEETLAARCPEVSSMEAARDCVVALRELAVQAHDNDALTLMKAFEDGASTREEVLVETTLSPQRYRNARVRLTKLLKRVRPETCDDETGC